MARTQRAERGSVSRARKLIRSAAHSSMRSWTGSKRPAVVWADLLSARSPELSAKTGLVPWQRRTALLVITLCISVVAWRPELGRLLLLCLIGVPFAGVFIFRAVALVEVLRGARKTCHPLPVTYEGLPHFSILVPLFKEPLILEQLVVGLKALEYPSDKLEVLFIVEERDSITRQGFASVAVTSTMAPNMQIIVVPPGLPQTKPRALNYALGMAGGEVLTVYDAEDIPEPDQLLKVARVLLESDEPIGCVQAGLNIYNAQDSWISRHFAIEYTALFEGFLPALARLGVPVPLGGTSNHFPRHVIEEIGGWDPYNVTEDADLGVRLARLGYRVEVIQSTTWEEAPTDLRTWIGQRSRWLKGWVQTYVVHMRKPGELLAELGPGGFAGFQVLMGGFMLSGLIHPWFYLLFAYDLWQGNAFNSGDTVVLQAAAALGWFNLVAGYLSAVVLGMAASLRRGWWALAMHTLLMPVYWLLVSAAAYRALIEYFRKPHHWEKTKHVGKRVG